MTESLLRVSHELKCWPQYFAALFDGRKRFEIRENDRNFKIGDSLILKEYDPANGTYSGRVISFRVSYITTFGQMQGYVVMGLTNALSAEREAQTNAAPLQLPPLTDLMYHAVRGIEYHFGHGETTVVGYLDDDCLDEIWENINTALRVSATPKLAIGGHDWVEGNTIVKWPHCAICGIIKRHDGLNKPCKGASKLALREYYTEGAAPVKPRFDKVYCSQCGGEFGPRDSGYSHCSDHRREAIEREKQNAVTQAPCYSEVKPSQDQPIIGSATSALATHADNAVEDQGQDEAAPRVPTQPAVAAPTQPPAVLWSEPVQRTDGRVFRSGVSTGTSSAPLPEREGDTP